MTIDRGEIPHWNVRSPSTTHAASLPKSGVPRRGQRRRQAPPLSSSRLYGIGAEVRASFRIRVHSEMWIEVEYEHGRFWVHHDVGLYDLLVQMQRGGRWVAPRREAPKRKRR